VFKFNSVLSRELKGKSRVKWQLVRTSLRITIPSQVYFHLTKTTHGRKMWYRTRKHALKSCVRLYHSVAHVIWANNDREKRRDENG